MVSVQVSKFTIKGVLGRLKGAQRELARLLESTGKKENIHISPRHYLLQPKRLL